jgi:hypothetical protein
MLAMFLQSFLIFRPDQKYLVSICLAPWIIKHRAIAFRQLIHISSTFRWKYDGLKALKREKERADCVVLEMYKCEMDDDALRRKLNYPHLFPLLFFLRLI